ncbi:hypothetical protein MY4038_009413 [Beauveria bassiana]
MAQSADTSFAYMGGCGSNTMPPPRHWPIQINEDAAWHAVMGRGDASGPSDAEANASSVLNGNGTEDESADAITDSGSSYQESVFSGHGERGGGYASSIMQPDFGSQVGQDPNATWLDIMEDSTARYYARSIAFSDFTGDGQEDARRPRFQPSLDGESVTDSYVHQESIFSGRGGRGGGHGSIFSSVHDGRTRASRTTAFSAAQRAMDNALADPAMEIDDDHATLVPPVVIAETGAGADIVDPDHWNQLGVTPTPTGIHASSASAMASWTGPASLRSAAASSVPSTDATEIVAHLPCEFRRYKACMDTFPLHRSGAGIDNWTDHMVRTRTHLYHRLPPSSGCWFCSETFSVDEQHRADRAVLTEVYKKRMRHIARHYLNGDVRNSTVAVAATPPRDAGFEEHLKNNGIWKPAPGDGGEAQQGAARVPMSNDLRDPIRDYTVGIRTPRSARSDAQYVTAGRRGRERAHHQ